jgi:hypothetical protein
MRLLLFRSWEAVGERSLVEAWKNPGDLRRAFVVVVMIWDELQVIRWNLLYDTGLVAAAPDVSEMFGCFVQMEMRSLSC